MNLDVICREVDELAVRVLQAVLGGGAVLDEGGFAALRADALAPRAQHVLRVEDDVGPVVGLHRLLQHVGIQELLHGVAPAILQAARRGKAPRSVALILRGWVHGDQTISALCYQVPCVN